MQKTNFITQLIFSDKADSLFVITSGLSMHVWPHPLEATNFYCFHEPLVTSKNSTWYLNLFARYSNSNITELILEN